MRQSRATLGTASSHDPSSVSQLKVLDKAIAAKLQDLDLALSLKSEGRSIRPAESILTDSANQTMNVVRGALRGLKTDYVLRTNQLQADIKREIENYYLRLGASIAANLMLLVGLVLRFRNAASRPMRSNESLTIATTSCRGFWQLRQGEMPTSRVVRTEPLSAILRGSGRGCGFAQEALAAFDGPGQWSALLFQLPFCSSATAARASVRRSLG